MAGGGSGLACIRDRTLLRGPGLRRPAPRPPPPAHARRARLRGADARPARTAIPPLLDGRDLLAEAPPAPARPRRSPSRCSSGSRSLDARRRPPRTAAPRVRPRPRPRAHPRARDAGRRGRPPLRPRAGVRVLPVYGGQPISQQSARLRRGVDVVVATPGPRASTTSTAARSASTSVEIVVLDEADEMLDMGFADELDAILSATPATRQTALFSATIPPRIARIAERHLREPVRVLVAARETRRRTIPRGPPDRLRRPPRRQAGGAGRGSSTSRTPPPRSSSPRTRRRGGRPGRGAQRARP